MKKTATQESIQPLQFTGKLFGGLAADIRRKSPHYSSDFKDGLNSKAVGSICFLFFACLANAIAFGGLTGLLTDGAIGTVEMIIATAIGGIIYALFAGQPLTLLGGTGPIVIFTGILYTLCQSQNLPFLTVYAWIGIWSGVFMIILSIVDASALMNFFTRFVDEIFAALVAVIFVVEALKSILVPFQDHSTSDTVALMTLVLAMGTFLLARIFKQFISTPYLKRGFREFVSDFGPAIAIALMTLFSLTLPGVETETAAIPDNFGTTSGRPWVVELFSAPLWLIAASIVPALLVTVLLFLDQNISARLVNSPLHCLNKGCGYHLDLLVVGVITLFSSVFALPWIVAATVHSLNHVKSLSTTSAKESESETITAVQENRVSALFIHILIGASLLALPYIKIIPMEVLFGLFLYMGLATLNGMDFFERVKLWITDKHRYPQNHYTRRVPTRKIHLFTSIQLSCLILLWILKSSSLGILFPLFIALLVPLRLILPKWFAKEDLELLDADEETDQHIDDPSVGDFRL